VKPRPRTPGQLTDQQADELTEFCVLLVDALQIPEVRAALVEALQHRPATPVVRPSPPARAQPHRRGHR
jgi:hypothetical protein